MAVQRGEIYWIDFNPSRGSEQARRRPGLVVRNDRGNRSSSTTVIAAISSAPLPRAYPFTVPLSAGEGGLRKASFVNCSQLLTVDQSRLVERIGQLDDQCMQQVRAALRFELDL